MWGTKCFQYGPVCISVMTWTASLKRQTLMPPGFSSRKSSWPLNISVLGLAPTPTTTMSLEIFLPLLSIDVFTCSWHRQRDARGHTA